MFTTGQILRHHPKKSASNAAFRAGMALDKRKSMRMRFTYKELSMIVGIGVALLIILLLWVNQPATSADTASSTLQLPGNFFKALISRAAVVHL